MTLNLHFLFKSLFTKRLQVIRTVVSVNSHRVAGALVALGHGIAGHIYKNATRHETHVQLTVIGA